MTEKTLDCIEMARGILPEGSEIEFIADGYIYECLSIARGECIVILGTQKSEFKRIFTFSKEDTSYRGGDGKVKNLTGNPIEEGHPFSLVKYRTPELENYQYGAIFPEVEQKWGQVRSDLDATKFKY